MRNRSRKNIIFSGRIALYLFIFFILGYTIFMTELSNAAEPAGKFTYVEGKVDVLKGGSPPAVIAKVPDNVFPGDIIRTKSNSKAEIILRDNSVLRIGQRSRIDISEYLKDDKNSRTAIKLQRGQIKAIVNKEISNRISLAPDANRFEIQTPNAVAGVRGTEFFVAYEQNTTTVLLKEGEVCVYNIKSPDNVVCLPPSYIVTITGVLIPQQPRKATETEMRIFENATAPAGPFSKTFPENLIAEKPEITGRETDIAGSHRPEIISIAETPTNITDIPLIIPITDIITPEPEPEPATERFRSVFSTNVWSAYPTNSDGSIGAAMSGNTTPWTSSASSRITGSYLTNSGAPHIWFDNNIYSFNGRNSTNTTIDGGAYRGFLSGKEINGSADARFNGIYIDPSGNIGILKGSFTGTTGNNSINLNGSLSTVQLGTSSMNASDFYNNVISFTAPFSINSETGIAGSGTFNSMNISGHNDWGISQIELGGSFIETPQSSWLFTASGSGGGFTFESDITGSQWSLNRLSGSATGYWMDLRTSSPSTGIYIGETTGTFNPSDHTWQTVTNGTWLETGKFLQMASDAAGRTRLQELNIPAFEVGRTDLSGSLIAGSESSIDYVSITMNNVAFFAPSTGGKPSIWATDDITGQYNFSNGFLSAGNITSAENTFTLSNGDSISADLRFTQWNTSNNTWSANISNGTGNLSGGSYNGPISFRGGAAGTLTGTNSGNLTGTGAGIVK